MQGDRFKSTKICFGKCGEDNPFFEIEREISADSENMVKASVSDVKEDTLNPEWKYSISMKEFCNYDTESRLRFKFYSKRSNGYHKPYGHLETTAKVILSSDREHEIRRAGKKVSLVTIKDSVKRERLTFSECLEKDWNLNLMCAIDFT